jgi:transcriptional regulator with XRE-family HTH domain
LLAWLSGPLVRLRHSERMSLRKSSTHPGHYIRAWRKSAGLSQERVAEYLGVTHGAISQLERGLINYTQESLEKLSELFACSPAELLIGPPEEIEQLRRARQVGDALGLLDALSEDRKDRIVRLIEDSAALEGKLASPPADEDLAERKP